MVNKKKKYKSNSSSIGVIGSIDGPSAIFLSDNYGDAELIIKDEKKSKLRKMLKTLFNS